MDDDTKNGGETVEFEEMSDSIDELTNDTIYHLLSHHRRRAVVKLLLTYDRTVTLRDLQNEIIEKEQEVDITEVSEEQAEQVLISLHHVHVPKLAEEGIVNYDRDRAVVEPRGKLFRLEPHLPQS